MRNENMVSSEEDALFTAWQLHEDLRARDLLVSQHMPLVKYFAGRIARSRKMDDLFDDFLQEGSLGLLRAIDKFDRARGVKFSAYAALWIRSRIDAYISNMIHMVRTNKCGATRRLAATYDKWKALCLQDDPHLRGHALVMAIAEKSGEKLKHVQYLEIQRRGTKSLHAETREGECLIDMLRSESCPEAETATREEAALVAANVQRVNARTLRVLEGRFVEDMTLQELGDELNMSREYVRILEKKGIDHIKHLCAA